MIPNVFGMGLLLTERAFGRAAKPATDAVWVEHVSAFHGANICDH